MYSICLIAEIFPRRYNIPGDPLLIYALFQCLDIINSVFYIVFNNIVFFW